MTIEITAELLQSIGIILIWLHTYLQDFRHYRRHGTVAIKKKK